MAKCQAESSGSGASAGTAETAAQPAEKAPASSAADMTDMDNPEYLGQLARPSPPVAEQGGWGLRGGPIYLSLQKTSASASRLSIYLSKSRAPLRFQPYLRGKNAILL